MPSKQSDETRLALIEQSLKNIEGQVTETKRLLETGYVPIQRYTPVEKIVFGLVGLILLGVGGAILSAVVKKGV